MLGKHQILFFQPSDKEVFSHSITSSATDPPASSEQNGGLSNGDGKYFSFLKRKEQKSPLPPLTPPHGLIMGSPPGSQASTWYLSRDRLP